MLWSLEGIMRRSIMKQRQTVGGIAALCLSTLFIGLLLLLAVVLPGQGYGPHLLDDPATGIRFVATSWLPVVLALIYIGNALAFVPLTLALAHRFRAAAPAVVQVIVAAGLIASGSWLAYGMISMISIPVVVSTYQHDAAGGGAIYLALRLTTNGMNAGAIFAAGWTISLVGWTALRVHGLPKLLSMLMLLAGILMILSFALLSVGLIGVLLAPVWSAWLGCALLRKQAMLEDGRMLAVVADA
jgi:hypothetical protein